MKQAKHLLVLNYGSSSLKYVLFDVHGKKLGKKIFYGQTSTASWSKVRPLLKGQYVDYVGFRVVHGADKYRHTVKINQAVLKDLIHLDRLAPLHNPPVIKLIREVEKSLPKAKMAASFDTAWFADLPAVSYLYSIPLGMSTKYKIRKYGFHGLSHEAAVIFAKGILKKKNPSLITCHFGSGSSIAWMERGKIIDTTMGFTPNEGLTMASRSGDIPADVVLYLQRQGFSLEKISNILNKHSGLYGLSGSADLRVVIQKSAHDKRSKLALQIYIYDIQRYLASYLAMSHGVDAIVFTGAIAQNKKFIRSVLSGLKIASKVKILYSPTGEMQNIAEKTIKCLVK